ncbi:hypothetical protein [Streptomyces sp. HUAS TT7]|uniref:hypothetical protein n=1 Tax=Streptomyces sp. HUAS TT7 TaxID=3447507 RepID=UPI003F65C529
MEDPEQRQRRGAGGRGRLRIEAMPEAQHHLLLDEGFPGAVRATAQEVHFPVWNNGTEVPVSWTLSLNTSTGWASQLGVSFTSSLGTGVASPVQTSVSLTISGQVTYDVRQDLGNSLTITVPSHQYGWVALSELATKVTGQWTFDVNGYPWKAKDTVTVPLKSDAQGRSSIYLAQTGPYFTTCNS